MPLYRCGHVLNESRYKAYGCLEGTKNDNMKSEHHTIAENTQTRVRPDTTSILQLHVSAGFGDFGGSNNKGHAAGFKKNNIYNVNKESQSKNVFPTILFVLVNGTLFWQAL